MDLILEIIVVDNNSSDTTINIIKKKYPSIILIVNSKNEGFARANNQAMKIAKGKYLFLLNPDTIISHNALEKFRAFLDKRTNADVWCIGGQLNDENGAPSKSYGKFPSILDVILEQSGLKLLLLRTIFKNWLKKNYVIEHRKEVQFVMGCNMFIRQNSLSKIGQFDESFFLNYEEIELCWRAKKNGFKSMVLPEVKIVHYSGKSFPNTLTYLNQLWLGQIWFFKLTRSKIYFSLVKIIHLAGAMVRYIIGHDRNHLKQITKIIEIH